MSSNLGSIIVINNSDKFSVYLDRSMISNVHFKDLDEFIQTYNNFPLTASKIIIFESGIINLDSIRKFSDIILNEVSQVGELLFLVGVDFKQYFLVSLDSFKEKKFLAEDITYRDLEEEVTETQSYTLKNEAELVNVIQRKRKTKEVDVKIDRFQTRVTIDRRVPNPKMEREPELLDREVVITETGESRVKNRDVDFNYVNYEEEGEYKSSSILVFDNGLNVYNMMKSEHSKGKKLLFIDYTDSLFFSFLVETDKTLSESLQLEDIYSGVVNPRDINERIDDEDLIIIRNSYNLKRTLNLDQMESLVKFIVGRYGSKFESVYILTDDIKICWEGMTRYLILPPSIDYLMKFVNYMDITSPNTTYLKLGGGSEISEFGIDENVVRSYLSNSQIDNVRVIDGFEKSGDSFLFDLGKLEGTINQDKKKRKEAVNI